MYIWKALQKAFIFDHPDEASGYGLGFTIWTDKKYHKLVFHNGIIAPGYSASMFCDLKTKIGVVMLRNDYGKPDIMELTDESFWKLNRAIRKINFEAK